MNFDIIVVGAGSAGSSAALFLAQKGYNVALLECRALENAGARWVNDIPPWMFERSGIDLPEPPEKIDENCPVTLIGKDESAKRYIPSRPMWGVDMRLFIKRLHKMLEKHKVEVFEKILMKDFDFDKDRPVSLNASVVSHNKGRLRLNFSAKLFIDATGNSQALLRKVPLFSKMCPMLLPNQFCNAAQEVCEINNKDGAIEFLKKYNILTGSFIAWTGIAGGFSTRMVHIDKNLENVSLLTGAINVIGYPSGTDIIKNFKSNNSWVGKTCFGGASLIPIRRPYDMLAIPGLALIGDSACQVFPAHGSGVGNGLIASRILADSISKFDDHGSLAAVWKYQANYHYERSAVNAAYELFTRLVSTLTEDNISEMLKTGMLNAGGIKSAFMQKMPDFDLNDVYQTLKGGILNLNLSMRLGRCIPRMVALYSAYSQFPYEPSKLKLLLWSQMISKITGDKPDLPLLNDLF